MHVVIARAGAERDVDLVVEDPQACVADLIAATDGADVAPGHHAAGVVVGGRYFGPDSGLDEIGLHEGALLRIADAPDLPARSFTGPFLAVVDGPDAGQLLEIGGTDVLVGRAAHCDLVLDDPTVSGEHARLRLHPGGAAEIVDLGSHNGTWVDGEPVVAPRAAPPGALLRLGAAHARIVTALPADRPFAVDPLHRATGGLVPFNRPPRPALIEPPAPVAAPEEPTTNQRVRALSLIMVIAPLILGGVLIWLYKDPRFAIFFLLSPVMAVGTWLSSRRAAKKEKRTAGKAFRVALATFDEQLVAAGVEERARREQLLPDAAEMLRRVHTPSMRLWQRRRADPDFMHLRAGVGDVPWEPPVDAPREGPPDEARERITARSVLERAPVEVDLSDGRVVGLVGTRSAALALARSLVSQAAAHHGPADLEIIVLTAVAEEWDWAKWLPHVRDEAGTGRRVAGVGASADLAHALLETPPSGDAPRFGRREEPTGPVRLVVVDDPALLDGRRAPARLLLAGGGGPAAGIVLTDTEDRLPAVTTTVIELHSDLGDADLRRPQEGGGVDHFTICGLSGTRAADAARTLARYEDPEVEVPGAGLPSVVRLLPLLGLDEVTAEEIARRWDDLADDPPPRGPVGMGEDGVVEIDLVRDGPHGLVGGTTGSGKSELLRSLVAALATNVDPDHLVFVLVDYKGGSAFDECARLPHTVGLVTDLDEHLGERALRSLEAELGHRERVLRAAGAADLPAYLAAGAPDGPLPRLVVVVDEFATLAAELPDFLGALVGVAQRGRSLGVHLILATQRPSGTVNANIKANTNLRIALRVQDVADSNDIIDRKDAAAIGRDSPGRAYVRRGPGDVEVVQTALSTAVASARDRRTGVRLLPFVVGGAAREEDVEDARSGPSDLARLVDAVGDAFVRRRGAAPRRPWLPMLPERVELADILSLDRGGAVPVPLALADDPDRQRQVVVGWNPAEGHLALFGMVGSGTSTGLLTVARALVEVFGPDECHLYAIDFGANALRQLQGLPHVGGVIAASDREAQHRLMRHLRAEVDRRRALSPAEQAAAPLIVVLVDGMAAFLAEHEGLEGAETADGFKRVFGDGPGVRICCVVAGDRPGALPMRLSSLVSQKLLFRLADTGDFSSIGVRAKNLPAFVPGRALHSDSKLVLQMGHPGDVAALSAQRAEDPRPSRPPVLIRSLPAEVRVGELAQAPRATAERLCLPVGVADEDLGTAELELYPVDHLLVAGPPRSGKSSVLRLLAEQTRRADPDAVLVGICDERSPLFPLELLDAAGPLDELARVVRAAQRNDRRWVLLVDDAPMVDDPDGLLAATLKLRRPRLHVVAAGRSDDVRSAYGHWTREVRQSRTGVLLQPNLSTDGELLGLKLPRRLAVPLVPGRGFVVSAGEARLAQLALPDGTSGIPPVPVQVATPEVISCVLVDLGRWCGYRRP